MPPEIIHGKKRHFYDSSAENAQPEFHEETLEKPRLRTILQNTWPIFLKTVIIIKNMENLRNCQNQEEPKNI